ncbi:MAG: methionyl-tRNA formyltransferase, partial [Thermodesulfovibrionales bacterium]
IPILPEDTGQSLSEKLSRIGAELLLETIHKMRAGLIDVTPQEGIPSYAPPLTKEDGRIDWSRSATDIFNLIRGMHPWPCAHTLFRGKYVKILKANPVSRDGAPGAVVEATSDHIAVATGKGALDLLLLQFEGKTPIGPGQFINGYRVKEGERFG